jgi:polar amino acid transport system permease protein
VLGDFRLEPTNETLRNLQRGTLAIGFAYAAYMAEIFRAGIRAVPRGQIEAARSLGLSGWQSVRFIILPQALKIVIPPLGNEFIAMLKDTALVSYVGTGEIFRLARQFGAATLNNIPPFQTAAVLYIILTLGASSMLKWLERRTGVSDKR